MTAVSVPAIGKVESVLLIGVVLLTGYVAYRAYKTGSTIASTVKQGLGDAWSAVKSTANDAYYQVKDETPEQAAESMAQIRNAERQESATAPEEVMLGKTPTVPEQGLPDWMMRTPSFSEGPASGRIESVPQQYSPDPLFMGPLTERGDVTEPEGSY